MVETGVNATDNNHSSFEIELRTNFDRILNKVVKNNDIKQYRLNKGSMKLFHSYANELTSSIIEQAANLAKHRNSNSINEDDVNLVLVKKHAFHTGRSMKRTHLQILKANSTSKQKGIHAATGVRNILNNAKPNKFPTIINTFSSNEVNSLMKKRKPDVAESRDNSTARSDQVPNFQGIINANKNESFPEKS